MWIMREYENTVDMFIIVIWVMLGFKDWVDFYETGEEQTPTP